ncbi:hypothetical protein CRG98_018214 [Punica granatum]|uniref:Uncharacterized protein n=1 Tax=Punica granatum TaxID=22663 RepID=A0A2I0K130_PUNGR|nr:hypothetical protein CRG98_018214 [Punica granatum]
MALARAAVPRAHRVPRRNVQVEDEADWEDELPDKEEQPVPRREQRGVEAVVDVCGVTSKEKVEYADEGEKLKVQPVVSSESKLEEQREYLENIPKGKRGRGRQSAIPTPPLRSSVPTKDTGDLGGGVEVVDWRSHPRIDRGHPTIEMHHMRG